VDAIGTAEVEDSGVCSFPDSGFLHRSSMTVLTVLLFMRNNSAIFRALMPSLCFSRIAAIDALASVCHASPSVAQRGLGEISGVLSFAKLAFSNSTASGRPRGWRIFPNWDFAPRRLQVVLGHRQMPLGHFAVVLGSPSGFCPKGIFRNLKDGPRDLFRFCRKGISGNARMGLGTTPDLGQSHFRRIARMDLGVLTGLGQSHFRHSPRQTSGVTFSQIGILLPPPDGPRGVQRGIHRLDTAGQTSGLC